MSQTKPSPGESLVYAGEKAGKFGLLATHLSLAPVPEPVGAELPRTETEPEVGFLNTCQSGKAQSFPYNRSISRSADSLQRGRDRFSRSDQP